MNDDIRPSDSSGSDWQHVPVSEPPREPQRQPFHSPRLNPDLHMPVHGPKPPKGLKGLVFRFKRWFRHLSKKQKTVLFSVIAGLLIASGLIWWFVFRNQPGPEKKQAAEETQETAPQPTTVPSCLKGAQVPPEQQNAPVTGIMIENSPVSRPQSGLYDADMVFEAIAEGGITRYLVLYQLTSPDYVGPVRSLRPYYLDFLTPFTNAVAHAGGSGQALAEVQNGYRNLEAFQHPSYFQRISSRAAPHNLYTNRAKLIELQNSLGANSTCTGFKYTTEDHPAPTPTARGINLRISSANFNVHYDYDPTTNSYLRSLGGQPHIDERANQQMLPKNVVALVMSHHYAGVYSVYGTTGSGVAYFFKDGVVEQGTWEKSGRGSQFILRGANKQEYPINTGQTWVSIVTAPDAVTYQP